LTEVASFELFVDLLFVGILAINGDHVGEAPDATEMHRFVITFMMGMSSPNPCKYYDATDNR
jgi:hypothetical protein